MSQDDEVGTAIARIEAGGDHRVLRRLTIDEGPVTAECEERPAFVGLVVDVETTGTDTAHDLVIELAARRFRYDEQGRMMKFGRTWSWREDPGRPLGEEIVRLTGITDADLEGRRIDDAAATALFRSADVVIAHNAGFDRKFVERRLPEVSGLAWACSCREIDWAARGFDGKGLGWLCAQAGWFFDAHRAGNDVDAVLALLGVTGGEGRTALRELLDTAERPSTLVSAVGASFDVKEDLRTRGYRWNAFDRVWAREIPDDARLEEEAWLMRHVYSPRCRPRAFEPLFKAMTWLERHG